jgi:hypothetical protein
MTAMKGGGVFEDRRLVVNRVKKRSQREREEVVITAPTSTLAGF